MNGISVRVSYAPVPFVDSKLYIDIRCEAVVNDKKFTYLKRFKRDSPMCIILEEFQDSFLLAKAREEGKA